MRESFRPGGTAVTGPARHPSRTVLSGVVAALLATLVVPPAPARAEPKCPAPAGGAAPTETPWALRRLDPASAWRITRGERVTVAVVDSGVSPTHPLLKGQVGEGRDFNGLAQMQGRCDHAGHGTIVAGIIAGRDDTGAPYSGVAPGARILPVRVLPDTQRTNDPGLPVQIAAAIRWAADRDVEVINLSLVTIDHPQLKDAVQYALDKGVVVVAAAGNRAQDQRDLPAYPAAYPGVIAVAGVDREGGHVGSSVSGNYVDIAAPGLDIVGPAPGGQGYLAEPEGGTSFAAAYVSGAAALLRSARPDLTPQQVAYRLTRTADNPPDGHNPQLGYGVVNPYRALTSLLGTRTDPPAGAMPPPASNEDPLGRQWTVALWAAGVATVLAAGLLIARPVVALGRRRGWRPGRRTEPADA
ncbi:type VII secretion-associated serine protease mycosin [Micromonospora halophytica]|uniref:Type VII secretion-associated serine protease mycosin n=1 Tax=Micromonospora halophytica TaxID=47864 RepID=A0A1C5IW13_9ACTN|nr:type VII secretion-associated serine protease mycosin [Micromonospora halophytica]SCG62505.1 type VII secretion-associated serine protease mycosin [Micromonospora halophytica]